MSECHTTVVIVESPAKCKKIESFLGPGYKCVASYGHMTTLKGLQDVDIQNNFKATFKIIESKQQTINRLENLVKHSDQVILATDDDREGEAIAWHICQLFNLPVKTTKRIIFHEITKSAIQKAVDNPTHINMNVVHAQQARQILDIIVGFKISPLLWSHITKQSKKGLSAGRCQTPALRIIYDNQKEIDKSPGKMAYTTTGYFTDKSIPFTLNFQYTEKEKMEHFLESSVDFKYIYTCGKVRNTTKKPPKPFTTSRIQQAANTELRISPKETMSLCQKLYEGGFITYMRTDSEIYSNDFLVLAKGYIERKWGEDYVTNEIGTMGKKSSKKTNGKKKEDKNAQEAHEAIRPTDVTCRELTDDYNTKEKKMYALIWRNTVESCMTAAKYTSITAVICAPENKEFRASAEQAVFPGWKVVGGYDETNLIYGYLKALKSIDTYKKIVSKVTLKELKQHYTEAKLVQLLEEKGIGRPSTFASLIEKVQDRGYVKRDNVKGKKISCVDYDLVGEELSETEHLREFGNEKNKLVIQSLGIIVIEFLLQHFTKLFDYDYTKNMENELDKIAKDELVWFKLCETCLNDINDRPLVKERKQIELDSNHIYMVGKYGPVVKYTDNDGETIKFKNVRKDIDVSKIENGEYGLEDIIEHDTSRCIGKYNNNDILIKKGKYGYYAQVGNESVSLANSNKDIIELTENDVIELLSGKSKTILRIISDTISLRKSKHGKYLYYKTLSHKKPEFIALKAFREDPDTCDLELLKNYVLKYKKK
jgi:DNA topoisomerase I|tara:strand:+ start:1428 stop:3725 length:2298 start_codon:yes stop_codon:yes gene_type:complete